MHPYRHWDYAEGLYRAVVEDYKWVRKGAEAGDCAGAIATYGHIRAKHGEGDGHYASVSTGIRLKGPKKGSSSVYKASKAADAAEKRTLDMLIRVCRQPGSWR